MMSEKEIELRRRNMLRLKSTKKINRYNDLSTDELIAKTRANSSYAKEEPTQDPELTIRVKESTVNALKTVSCLLDDNRGNDFTYDNVVLYLTEFDFFINRHRTYKVQRGIPVIM